MKKILQLVLILILLSFLVGNIASDWSTILTYWQNLKLNWLILSFVMALLIYPEGALCWYVVLKKMGIKISILKTTQIWIIANTSRFLPGSIWQYLGRVELSTKFLTRGTTILSMVVEIFFVLLASILIWMIVLPSIDFKGVNVKWVLLFLPLILLLTHPAIFKKVIKIASYFLKKKIDLIDFKLGFKEITTTLPFFMFNFVLNGLALSFLIASFTDNLKILDIVIYSGFYAFSWMIGYLSFFAPGGIGVMEVTLTILLGQNLTLPLASLVVLFYRVLLTASELIIFMIIVKLKTYE